MQRVTLVVDDAVGLLLPLLAGDVFEVDAKLLPVDDILWCEPELLAEPPEIIPTLAEGILQSPQGPLELHLALDHVDGYFPAAVRDLNHVLRGSDDLLELGLGDHDRAAFDLHRLLFHELWCRVLAHRLGAATQQVRTSAKGLAFIPPLGGQVDLRLGEVRVLLPAVAASLAHILGWLLLDELLAERCRHRKKVWGQESAPRTLEPGNTSC